MTLATKPLGDAVGAEVVGLDPEQLLSDADFPAACMAALEGAGVLVFRALHIDDATQIALSQRLDQVGKTGPAPAPTIFNVTLDPAKNPVAEYLRGTFAWHIDGAQDDVPTKATLLSAHAVAASGGETEFASTYAAFERLPEDEKRELGTLRVVHTFEASQRLANPSPSPEEVARWRERPDKVHPLVWRHRSSRRSLVIGASASHIEDMEVEAGRALLADLLSRSTEAEQVYRHDWSVGDVVVWDNTGVMHRACPYDPASVRELHRTTMSGDEPIQ